MEPAVGTVVPGLCRCSGREKVLDAGCGTGSLSATLAKVTGASEIVGIDPSKAFIEYARIQVADPRVSFEVGDAQDLRYPDHTFDVCVALLAVDHIPDAPKAAKEMRRVTKTLGIVATAMWDRSHDNELYGCFWDAAEATDPTAKRPSGGTDRTVLPKHFHSSGIALV